MRESLLGCANTLMDNLRTHESRADEGKKIGTYSTVSGPKEHIHRPRVAWPPDCLIMHLMEIGPHRERYQRPSTLALAVCQPFWVARDDWPSVQIKWVGLGGRRLVLLALLRCNDCLWACCTVDSFWRFLFARRAARPPLRPRGRWPDVCPRGRKVLLSKSSIEIPTWCRPACGPTALTRRSGMAMFSSERDPHSSPMSE